MPSEDPTTTTDKPQGRYPRNNRPKVIKRNDTHKWFECQFLDCPRKSTLMKVPIGRGGRGPTYHTECRDRLKQIRTRRDGTPDGRPLLDDIKGDPLQPATPEDRARLNIDICGEQRRGRVKGICCMPAGWGTGHPGIGACKLHRGNTPSGNVSAAKKTMLRDTAILGAPIEIDPHSAVLQEIHRTAGHVEWLRVMIQAMGVEPETPMAEVVAEETAVQAEGARRTLMQFSEKGMMPSVWMELYQKERTHLVRTCKMAVDMGCAERQVQLAEGQGRLIATVMRKIFTRPELNLNNAQKAALGPIVREEMMALEAETQSTKQEASK